MGCRLCQNKGILAIEYNWYICICGHTYVYVTFTFIDVTLHLMM